MSKPICALYAAATTLLLLATGTAAGLLAAGLIASRVNGVPGDGSWSGPGTRLAAWVETAGTWLLRACAAHGAAIAAIAAAVAAAMLFLLLLMARSAVRRAPRLVLSRGALGIVSVDLKQVSLLAQHEAEGVSGVREANTAAAAGKAGLSVQQTIAVEPDTAFARLAEQVQERVKRSLEFHLGLPVASVEVLLRHTTLSRRPL